MSSPPRAQTRPKALLARLKPFVVAPRWRFPQLDLKPLGVPVEPAHQFDILRSASEQFLNRLIHLDRLTFGTVGMPMPAWLFNDFSALPGVIAGLGMPARNFPPDSLERLRLGACDDELVPLSMFIAVPVRPPTVWYGHNLASLNRHLPELRLRGLAGVTKALGLRVMQCTEQIGATQWTSEALFVHTRFGPLELLTAWTLAHMEPATLTYRLRITASGITNVLHGCRHSTPDTFWLNAREHQALRALQQRIEHGERYAINGPPIHDADGTIRVPITKLTPTPPST